MKEGAFDIPSEKWIDLGIERLVICASCSLKVVERSLAA
jgi:hypothetical protein